MFDLDVMLFMIMLRECTGMMIILLGMCGSSALMTLLS